MSGPASYGLYKLIVWMWPKLTLALSGKAEPIAEILITSTITLMGFLATIITILFSISSSRAFVKYKRYGYDQVFFILYYTALVSLGITASLSLGVFSRAHGPSLFPWMIMLAISAFVQVATLTMIIVRLMHKSFGEA